MTASEKVRRGKMPTYGQWLREVIREEFAKQKRGKYWLDMDPSSRIWFTMKSICRRVGITNLELRRLAGCFDQPEAADD